MMHRSGSVRRMWLALCALCFAAALSGCAAKIKNQTELVFWPPAPSYPRIQFLKSINGDYDVVDPKKGLSLLTIGDQAASKLNPFIKPNGVGVRDGKIYVCDPGRSTVFIMDLKNQTFESLPGNKNLGALNKPMSLAFDDKGNLYVADVNRREIVVYSAQGQYIGAMGRSLDLKPTAVGVDGDLVYVSDLLHSDIKVLDRNTGEMLDSIGRDAADYRDQLSVPANLTVDEQGFIHVTNIGTGRIVTLDRDGHVVRAFGRMGTNFANFGRPKGIAVDHQGQTYIVDAAHQNVQIFNDEGRLLMYFGGADALAGSMNLPAGIAVTRDNLDYYQTLASPDFELESVLLVTNHFGDNRLGVYGIGKLRGVDYEKEYQAVRKELEEMARKEKERRAAEQKSE